MWLEGVNRACGQKQTASLFLPSHSSHYPHPCPFVRSFFVRPSVYPGLLFVWFIYLQGFAFAAKNEFHFFALSYSSYGSLALRRKDFPQKRTA